MVQKAEERTISIARERESEKNVKEAHARKTTSWREAKTTIKRYKR